MNSKTQRDLMLSSIWAHLKVQLKRNIVQILKILIRTKQVFYSTKSILQQVIHIYFTNTKVQYSQGTDYVVCDFCSHKRLSSENDFLNNLFIVAI
jgi:hypothetical protein